MQWIYPVITGKTFFDVWTLFHLAFWFFMGSNFWSLRNFIELKYVLLIGIFLSYIWEFFEKYAEKKWPNLWLNPESWLNSYISDPLTSIIAILSSYYVLNNWR